MRHMTKMMSQLVDFVRIADLQTHLTREEDGEGELG